MKIVTVGTLYAYFRHIAYENNWKAYIADMLWANANAEYTKLGAKLNIESYSSLLEKMKNKRNGGKSVETAEEIKARILAKLGGENV